MIEFMDTRHDIVQHRSVESWEHPYPERLVHYYVRLLQFPHDAVLHALEVWLFDQVTTEEQSSPDLLII